MAQAALVTGAARRIGRALALEAARAGYDIAIHHRGAQSDAESLALEIAALGRRSVILTADLSHNDQLSCLIPDAVAALGPVTLLVNCASLFEDDRLPTLTPASLDAHIAVNLRAPILLMQAVDRARGAETDSSSPATFHCRHRSPPHEWGDDVTVFENDVSRVADGLGRALSQRGRGVGGKPQRRRLFHRRGR